MRSPALLLLLASLSAHASPSPPPLPHTTPHRSFDGTGNNLEHPLWGAAETPFIFAETRPAPSARPLSNLTPGVRAVSSALFATRPSAHAGLGVSTAALSELFTYFGQWVTVDLVHARSNASDPAPIALPADDWARPYLSSLGFSRTRHAPAPAGRAQLNSATAFLDGEQVYGASAARAAALRTFSGGRLKTSDGNGLPDLRANECGCAVANPRQLAASAARFAGSERANVHLPMLALHTVFVREHNRQCAALEAEHPAWDDEQLYARARLRVVALLQHIVVYDWLPKLVGALPPYEGYNASVDPSIDHFFATAAFRYGHSALGGGVTLRDEEGRVAQLPLRTSIFAEAQDELLDAVLAGAISTRAQEVDLQVVDDLRGFLLSSSGLPAGDLVALNLQRGRDHALPPYNEARAAYNLSSVPSFAALTADAATASTLTSLYGSIDRLDAYVGMLAEPPAAGLAVGELARRAITAQFIRTRAADRLWYERDAPDGAGLTPAEREEVRRTSFGALLARNTNLSAAASAAPFTLLGACEGEAKAFSFRRTLGGGRQVAWERQGDEVQLTLRLPADSWLAVGFGSTDGAMVGADILTAHVGGADGRLAACATAEGGGVWVCDRSAAEWRYESVPVPLDTALGGTADVRLDAADVVDGVAEVRFSRPVEGAEAFDLPLRGVTLAIFAYGDGNFGYHGGRVSKAQVDLDGGGAVVGGGGADLSRERLRLLHGAFLTLAWGMMVPTSVFTARYGIHTSWFVGTHVALNVFSIVVTWAMYFTAREMVVRHMNSPHAFLGLLLLCWSTAHLVFTVVGKLLRHSLRKHRVASKVPWGLIHRTSGRLLLCVSAAQLYLGLEEYRRVTAEDYTIVWFIWYGLLLAAFLVAEVLYRRSAKVEHLVLITTGKRPEIALPRQFSWHVFLSHVWSSGQDQMAVLKRRLVQLLPGWKCFLDVDDLDDISRLEAYIDRSGSVLFFISAGYFQSKNCLREVRRAVDTDKTCILLLETDEKKGGLTLDAAQHECPEALRGRVFAAERQVIPWHRLSAYQMLSLRLIVEAALVHTPHRGARLTYRSEVLPSQVKFKKRVRLYASKHNPGAARFADELADAVKQLERVDSFDADDDVFVLYLNAHAFSGPEGLLLARELRAARAAHARVFMVHENCAEHAGCDFSIFFNTTPRDLINGGLYDVLASPVYPTPHRELSLALAAKGLREQLARHSNVFDGLMSAAEHGARHSTGHVSARRIDVVPCDDLNLLEVAEADLDDAKRTHSSGRLQEHPDARRSSTTCAGRAPAGAHSPYAADAQLRRASSNEG
ncbi:hypothetical protein AB1Y20_021989 [Prymnesium parvum]|uniref:DOMON domain-containing protein n=1 Tax=Prymnesium parvum TaxID=97485 RepID=A0AB34JHF3_PRYPA